MLELSSFACPERRVLAQRRPPRTQRTPHRCAWIRSAGLQPFSFASEVPSNGAERSRGFRRSRRRSRGRGPSVRRRSCSRGRSSRRPWRRSAHGCLRSCRKRRTRASVTYPRTFRSRNTSTPPPSVSRTQIRGSVGLWFLLFRCSTRARKRTSSFLCLSIESGWLEWRRDQSLQGLKFASPTATTSHARICSIATGFASFAKSLRPRML
mmetsp:Transcript_24967/g.81799  ORF Transcript_24967/g.81799 Transcript_24967/m.81799 type:complete len:209 (+) Transcript_24967:224-850(+)